MLWIRLLSIAVLALAGCDGDSDSQPQPDGADAGGSDAESDAALDVGPPPEPTPEPFSAGAATVRMPVPVGIGTSGFGFTSGPTSKTPFANIYPGTTGVQTHPDFRAVVIEAGDGRLILVRSDTIGVSGAIRASLVERLTERFGPDVDHQLLVGATHTHSGPGRLIDKPMWNLIADDFFPEFYERMVEAMAAAVLAAADDLEPAHVGHGVAMTTRLHSDRRCANPEEAEPELPIVRIDRASDGKPKAVLLFHAIHGTVLDMDELVLSQDVSGGIEAKVAEGFDHPVTVILFNGAAGDMAPGSPDVDVTDGASPWPRAFARTEALGIAAAEDLGQTVDGITTVAEGVVRGRTAYAPLNRAALGYVGDEFPYEFGAVYCGAAQEERCHGGEPNPKVMDGCIVLPDAENGAPDRAPVSAFQLGDLMLTTGPGEFTTRLGRRVREAVTADTGFTDVLFVGYAQEYTGYNVEVDDFWLGGYEASGTLWGPRQGEYLADAAAGVAAALVDSRRALPFEPAEPVPSPGAYTYEPRATMPSTGPAALIMDIVPAAAQDAALELVFSGGDPWLGNPVVALERKLGGGGWGPVTTPDGRAVDSDGYVITLHLEPDPPYIDRRAAVRTFAWTARLPLTRTHAGGPDLTQGPLRLVARGRILVDGADAPSDYEVVSASFP